MPGILPALHFQCLPTELDPELVKDYLYGLQQRSKSPSQTYFKHTVYGLRFLLKSFDLPYDFLKLPAMQREDKLPMVLSKQEVWQLLRHAPLLKHKVLIGLLYGCGLRSMEVRSIRLADLDFDRGFLSSSWKKNKLQTLQKALHHTPPAVQEASKLRKCPCCKTGTLATVGLFGQRGPPLCQIRVPSLTSC
jgi:integrase